IIPNLERRWQDTESNAVREELGKCRSVQACPECHGSLLRREARYVLLGPDGAGFDDSLAIYQVEAMPLARCLEWFEGLRLSGAREEIAQRVVREIAARLRFLNNVGLNYLSLDRSA